MVRIIYILIALFIICIESVFAQYYEMGERKGVNTSSTMEAYCELTLQKDKYFILFTLGTSELSSSFFVSYGFVHKSGNTYYLQDIPCGAEIVVVANHDKSELIIRKGFSFMKNEHFLLRGDIIDDELESVIDIEAEYLRKKERDLYNMNKKSSHPVSLRLGVYKNESITLSLDDDLSYRIQYHWNEYSPIISEGKWSKDGNILKLYDSFLDYSFTALIDSDEIIVVDFPNDAYPNCCYSPIENEMLPLMVK